MAGRPTKPQSFLFVPALSSLDCGEFRKILRNILGLCEMKCVIKRNSPCAICGRVSAARRTPREVLASQAGESVNEREPRSVSFVLFAGRLLTAGG
jgi:hypothetical protein